MRTNHQNPFGNNMLINLKNQDWLDKQRIAGKIAAKTLLLLKKLVEEKTSHSTADLSQIAEKYILEAGGTPTFKGYKGFPTAICISINNVLVHGVPNQNKLNDGDLVSFDLGVTYEGAIADTAITCIFGHPKSERHIELIKTTEDCLIKAIESIKVGKRIGCIGHTIYKHAKEKGFGVITNYGGHGLSWNTPHDSPFISNKSNPEEGIRVQPGLSIAIEPLLCIGSPETKTLSDGWSVITEGINCHFEHSLFVHEDYVEILSSREII